MNALFLSTLALCWLVPDHFPPWTAFHTEAPAFAATFFGLLACRSRTKTVVVPKLALVCGLLGLTAVMQWALGLVQFGGDAILAVVYLLTLGIASVWGFNQATRQRATDFLQPFALFLLVVALATSFQLLAQWLHVEDRFMDWVLNGLPGGRPRANLGQPNHAATILVIASVGAAALKVSGRIGSVCVWMLLLLFTAATTLTQSRTGLLSLTLVALISLAYLTKNPTDKHLRKGVLFWLALNHLTFWVFGNVSFLGLSPALRMEDMAAVGTRPIIWGQLSLAVLERPWFGWGWLQVAAAQQFGALSITGTEQAIFAHNLVLDLAVMLGIPSAAAMVFAVGLWFWHRKARIYGSANNMFLLCGLTPLAVHSMLEFPHAYAYYLVIAGIFAGALEAWTGNERERTFEMKTSALIVFTCIWVGLLFTLGREYLLAEEDFKVNRFENRRLGSTPLEYEIPDLNLLTQLGDTAKAMRYRAQPDMSAAELATLKDVSLRYTWAPLHFRTALALAINNRPQEAETQLRVLKSLFSTDIYNEAKDNFLKLQEEKYPQLSKVALP